MIKDYHGNVEHKMAALLWRQQIARQTENRFKYFVHLFIKRQAQDAAYCYQYFVVCVCLCVCVSLNHNRAPYKNGWTDRGAVWDMARRIIYYVGTRILPGNGAVVWRGASPGPLWSTGGSSDAAFRCQKRSCLPFVQYTLWVKKTDSILLSVTSPNVNLFSKFFHG